MTWRWPLPGWPMRGALDLRLLEERLAPRLDPAPAGLWETVDRAGWHVRAAVRLPAVHVDLSEPDLRPLLDRVEAHFQSLAERQSRAAGPASGGVAVTAVLSCDDGEPRERLAVADWLWTLAVRRLEFLAEKDHASLGLSAQDLADLDELAETAYHHRRARLERGEIDGAGMLLALSRRGDSA